MVTHSYPRMGLGPKLLPRRLQVQQKTADTVYEFQRFPARCVNMRAAPATAKHSMSVNPFPFAQTRDLAATSALELGASGGRAVSSAKGSRRVGEEAEADEARRQPHGEHGQPREERERDAQRQALAKLILSAFELWPEPHPAQADTTPVADSAPPGTQPPKVAVHDPRLEAAILEFMYALFQALDQLDESEPTIEFVTRPMGIGPGSGRTGRNLFGERLDQLARNVATAPIEALTKGGDSLPGFEGIEPRLANSYFEVLQLLQVDGRSERPGANPRAQLAGLLMRLANAMQVASTLGYGMPSAAGAMLRVRA